MTKYLSLLFVLLIVHSAFGIGSVVKNDYVRVGENETARFRILFWSAEDASYSVELSAAHSNDSTVIILPEKFILDGKSGSENIILPYASKPVLAIPVDVFAIPLDAKGREDIVVTAKITRPNAGIAFSQEHEIRLSAGFGGFHERIKSDISSETGGAAYFPTENNSAVYAPVRDDYGLYFIAILLIAVLSFVIYKLS